MAIFTPRRYADAKCDELHKPNHSYEDIIYHDAAIDVPAAERREHIHDMRELETFNAYILSIAVTPHLKALSMPCRWAFHYRHDEQAICGRWPI